MATTRTTSTGSGGTAGEAGGTQLEYTSNGAFVVAMAGVTDEKEHFFAIEGLSLQYSTDLIIQGGDLTSYYLPDAIQTSPLYFKRPVTNVKSGLVTWCCDALENGIFKPTDVNIFLTGADGEIINQWTAEKAIPTGMNVSAMDINSNSYLIETLTLVYQKLKRIK